MKIDGMVEVSKSANKSKVLTSKKARQSVVVDPKVQISDEELKNHSRYQQGQGSGKPLQHVTSQKLIDKYQRR